VDKILESMIHRETQQRFSQKKDLAVSNWYVLRSKPHKEDFLYGQLRARKIEVCYPKVRVQPSNPRARKIKALYPGYLFIHVNLAEIGSSTLQWLPGAIGLVSFDHKPAMVADSVVNFIRKQVDAINVAGGESLAKLKKGDEIVIQGGPFDGYQAIFDLSLPSNNRVLVLLKLIEAQNIRMELPANQVKKI
jgi:transcription antitermination factor NusG